MYSYIFFYLIALKKMNYNILEIQHYQKSTEKVLNEKINIIKENITNLQNKFGVLRVDSIKISEDIQTIKIQENQTRDYIFEKLES